MMAKHTKIIISRGYCAVIFVTMLLLIGFMLQLIQNDEQRSLYGSPRGECHCSHTGRYNDTHDVLVMFLRIYSYINIGLDCTFYCDVASAKMDTMLPNYGTLNYSSSERDQMSVYMMCEQKFVQIPQDRGYMKTIYIISNTNVSMFYSYILQKGKTPVGGVWSKDDATTNPTGALWGSPGDTTLRNVYKLRVHCPDGVGLGACIVRDCVFDFHYGVYVTYTNVYYRCMYTSEEYCFNEYYRDINDLYISNILCNVYDSSSYNIICMGSSEFILQYPIMYLLQVISHHGVRESQEDNLQQAVLGYDKSFWSDIYANMIYLLYVFQLYRGDGFDRRSSLSSKQMMQGGLSSGVTPESEDYESRHLHDKYNGMMDILYVYYIRLGRERAPGYYMPDDVISCYHECFTMTNDYDFEYDSIMTYRKVSINVQMDISVYYISYIDSMLNIHVLQSNSSYKTFGDSSIYDNIRRCWTIYGEITDRFKVINKLYTILMHYKCIGYIMSNNVYEINDMFFLCPCRICKTLQYDHTPPPDRNTLFAYQDSMPYNSPTFHAVHYFVAQTKGIHPTQKQDIPSMDIAKKDCRLCISMIRGGCIYNITKHRICTSVNTICETFFALMLCRNNFEMRSLGNADLYCNFICHTILYVNQCSEDFMKDLLYKHTCIVHCE